MEAMTAVCPRCHRMVKLRREQPREPGADWVMVFVSHRPTSPASPHATKCSGSGQRARDGAK